MSSHRMIHLFTDAAGDHYQCQDCDHETRWLDGKRIIVRDGDREAIHTGGWLAVTSDVEPEGGYEPVPEVFKSYLEKGNLT